MKDQRLAAVVISLISVAACADIDPGSDDQDLSSEASEIVASDVEANVTDPSPRFGNCPSWDVCFYTGINGSGSMCHWDVADPDWTTGNVKCSWAKTSLVRSMVNKTASTVTYYPCANGGGSPLSTTKPAGWSNLPVPSHLRSHFFGTQPTPRVCQ